MINNILHPKVTALNGTKTTFPQTGYFIVNIKWLDSFWKGPVIEWENSTNVLRERLKNWCVIWRSQENWKMIIMATGWKLIWNIHYILIISCQRISCKKKKRKCYWIQEETHFWNLLKRKKIFEYQLMFKCVWVCFLYRHWYSYKATQIINSLTLVIVSFYRLDFTKRYVLFFGIQKMFQLIMRLVIITEVLN